MSPLNRSQYTVNSTKHFIKSIKHEKIPTGYQMISLDVKSLFTSIPLDKTIEITLQRIYNRNEITTPIRKKVMKELLLLCTKEVHFAFSHGIYQQNDDVAMGSPLGPVLARLVFSRFFDIRGNHGIYRSLTEETDYSSLSPC